LKALILAGGFGTRLRPLSCTRPKILFPILNKPLLQRTLERLAQNGINEVILAVNYQTEFYIKNSKIPKNGIKIIYSRDPPTKPLGTGGPIKNAQKFIGFEPFMVVNGDIFTDINYKEILKVHEEKNAVATIALHRVEDPSKYGVAELTNDNHIKKFIEKPPKEVAPTNLINAGVYVLNPEILNRIPEKQKVSMEREIFPKLAEEGKLYGCVFNGLWKDIGEIKDYLEVNKILLEMFAKKQKHKIMDKVKVNKPIAFDKEVSVGTESIIGPNVILGQNVNVGSNVCIKNSVVFPRVVISDSSSINGAIIGEGVVIGRRVKIGEGCVIGDYAVIRDNVSLAKEVSVCPAKEVCESVLTAKCIM
jgi:mannose-1-phosphate guanylyltransferase